MRGDAMKRLFIGLVLITAVAGCATVSPYEKETLARRDMQLQRNPDAAAGAQHASAYREGASGAEGSSGGGCGCN
jgi:hypothetical protein